MAQDPAFADWVLESLSTGIVAIDEEGGVVRLNDDAHRILGCPEPRAVLGSDCRKALRAQPAVVKLLLDALDGRRSLSRAELLLEGAGERGRSTIGFSLAPVRDDAARLRGAAMVFRDLTPFEHMDEQEHLRERLAALGHMAAGMAHEIRNPLAGMEIVAGLLQRRLAGRPEELALVDQLIAEVRGIARTVTESLDFVRPVSPTRVPVDAVALLEDALAVALARVPFEGPVERVFAERPPPLLGDAEQLRDVLADVIVNALEAMADAEGPSCLGMSVDVRPDDGSARLVRIGADGCPALPETSTEVLIRITDSGPGIPPELREKIFYPFFTTKQRGSGVGLANAQKVVASHGGTLEIASGPRVGTSVCVALPAAGRTS